MNKHNKHSNAKKLENIFKNLAKSRTKNKPSISKNNKHASTVFENSKVNTNISDEYIGPFTNELKLLVNKPLTIENLRESLHDNIKVKTEIIDKINNMHERDKTSKSINDIYDTLADCEYYLERKSKITKFLLWLSRNKSYLDTKKYIENTKSALERTSSDNNSKTSTDQKPESLPTLKGKLALLKGNIKLLVSVVKILSKKIKGTIIKSHPELEAIINLLSSDQADRLCTLKEKYNFTIQPKPASKPIKDYIRDVINSVITEVKHTTLEIRNAKFGKSTLEAKLNLLMTVEKDLTKIITYQKFINNDHAKDRAQNKDRQIDVEKYQY